MKSKIKLKTADFIIKKMYAMGIELPSKKPRATKVIVDTGTNTMIWEGSNAAQLVTLFYDLVQFVHHARDQESKEQEIKEDWEDAFIKKSAK